MLWVDGHKIAKLDVPIKAVATTPYTEDDVVRDFDSWEEARAFAASTTDYIGNLDGPVAIGTWVRYAPENLNIIGENHTYVTLDQITTAVRSQNFIYERFGADTLPPDSEFRKAYLTENTVLLTTFGVDLGGNLALVGGESLLPKIADTVAELVPYFNKTQNMTDMTSGANRYIGKPDQRYVKIGWGWAKDLVGHTATNAEIALVQAVTKHHDILD